MHRGRDLFLLCWVLCVASGLPAAQVSDLWRPVPSEDLQLKDNPARPGSSAMILEREIYTDDEKRFQTEWVRIKIFSEDGMKYADVEIPYLAKGTTIEDIRGRTVHADGTSIEFRGAAFDKVVAKYKRLRYQAKTFTLPAVEVGAIIEYVYTVHWKESLPDVVRNPGTYLITQGWAVPTATWTIQEPLFTRHARFTLRPVKNGNLGWAKVRLPTADPVTQSDGTVRLDANNVAALEEEEFMPPESILNSRVHFYYRVGWVANFWFDYGKQRASFAKKWLERTKSLERIAAEIAPPSDPPEVRLRKLYARVQQVRYISYEPSRTEKEINRENLAENKSAEDVLRHGYAHANQINLLFAALARAAGFGATVVQVVDRRIGMFEPTVLDPSQLTAMVVVVSVDGKNVYLDPATRFCPYGLVPWFESDTAGVTWQENGGQIGRIPAAAAESATLARTADLTLKPDGELQGKLEITYTGQEALEKRLQALDTDETGHRKLVEDEIKAWLPPGARIDLDSFTGWQSPEEPLRVVSRLRVPRFAVLTPQRMLFPLAVFQVNRKYLLPYAHRVQPVYFGYGYHTDDKVTLALPPGYQIESLPRNTEVRQPDMAFQANHAGEGGAMRLERHVEMNAYYFPVEIYGSLRRYFWKLRDSDAEIAVIHVSAGTAR